MRIYVVDTTWSDQWLGFLLFSSPSSFLDEDEKGNLGAKAPAVLDFYEHVNSRRRPCSPNFLPPLLPFYPSLFPFRAVWEFFRSMSFMENWNSLERIYLRDWNFLQNFLQKEIFIIRNNLRFFFFFFVSSMFVSFFYLFFPLLYFNGKSYSFFFFYLSIRVDIGIWKDFSKETDLYRIGNLGTESFWFYDRVNSKRYSRLRSPLSFLSGFPSSSLNAVKILFILAENLMEFHRARASANSNSAPLTIHP